MQLFDLHTHTTYSDGRDTPEEMIKEALERGLMCFGISDHSPTPFDPPGGMGRDPRPEGLGSSPTPSRRQGAGRSEAPGQTFFQAKNKIGGA